MSRRKLLLLNGAHSALAYGGLLRGHDYVHQAVADARLMTHIRALWAEAGARSCRNSGKTTSPPIPMR